MIWIMYKSQDNQQRGFTLDDKNTLRAKVENNRGQNINEMILGTDLKQQDIDSMIYCLEKLKIHVPE